MIMISDVLYHLTRNKINREATRKSEVVPSATFSPACASECLSMNLCGTCTHIRTQQCLPTAHLSCTYAATSLLAWLSCPFLLNSLHGPWVMRATGIPGILTSCDVGFMTTLLSNENSSPSCHCNLRTTCIKIVIQSLLHRIPPPSIAGQKQNLTLKATQIGQFLDYLES